MASIYSFDGFTPVVHESAFIHPNATVIGNVTMGRDVYIGPSAVLRGDWGGIVIADGCNIQENCTIHMFPGITVKLDENAHIGHGAVIHGAHIGRDVLVGMNAVVMDRVTVGAGSLVGALCFVPEGMTIPPRKIVTGNPATIVADMSDERLAHKTAGTRLYQQLPEQLRASMRATEPLREAPPDRPEQTRTYRTFRETQER